MTVLILTLVASTKGGEGEGMFLLQWSVKWRIRDARECIKVDIFGTRLGMQGL